MIFSDGEKLIIAMLSGLYKHLEVESDIDPDFVMGAIARGHYWGLASEYPGLFEAEPVADDDVDEVAAIVNMWRNIYYSYDRLADGERNKLGTLTADDMLFPGFDGNDEITHFSIINFFVNSLGRYDELNNHPQGLNTHHPSLRRYHRMLKVYQNIKEERGFSHRDLTAEQIKAVLDAG